DPGGYGGLTINRSISIVNDGGGEASILAYAGQPTGITINAPAAAIVNLRGLTVEGFNGSDTGIRFNTGKSLTITNCVVRFLTTTGIDFRPPASANLSVSNTVMADNGGSGTLIAPTGSNITVRAVFNRVESYNNGGSGILVNGFVATGGTINAV